MAESITVRDYPTHKTLHEAFKEYTETAIKQLQSICPPSAPQVLSGLDVWRRDSDGAFRLYDHEEPYWVPCIQRNRELLHSLPQYSHLVDTLRNDAQIAPLLDALVGTAFMSRRIDLEQITDHFVFAVPREIGRLEFDVAIFDRILIAFEVDLRKQHLTHILLVPLLGVSIEHPPIQLGPGIEIDVMTDAEIIRCLGIGLLPDDIGLQRMRMPKQEAAIRLSYDVEKFVGRHTSSLTRSNPMQDAVEKAMAVLRALRVFKEGRVTAPGFLHFSDNWPAQGASHFTLSNPGAMPWANKYPLHSYDKAALVEFWRHFEEVTGSGALANAVRRFSYASERDRPDDQLVDLMIAAESIFLSDSGAPEGRGELRYRLALRAAFFIDSKEYSKKELYRHMRRAYDARSALVHGAVELDPHLL